VAARDDRDGPWSYGSQVEDFELTYRIRELGYHCNVSPKVRAYTDAMDTVRSLWGQRMKWQVGTAEDLIRFGVNPLTRLDWRQQLAGALSALIRIGSVVLTVWGALLGVLTFTPVWFVLPILFATADVKRAMRIPHRDRWDIVLAACLVPQEIFAWMRAGWFCASWCEVLITKITGRRKDHWNLQYAAEGRG